MSLSKRTLNAQVLASFVDYCQRNPELRFWQALLNWSGQRYIFVSEHSIAAIEKGIGAPSGLRDPYSWEGRDG